MRDLVGAEEEGLSVQTPVARTGPCTWTAQASCALRCRDARVHVHACSCSTAATTCTAHACTHTCISCVWHACSCATAATTTSLAPSYHRLPSPPSYHPLQVLYCSDDVHSQQNRCLVSGAALRAARGAAPPDEASSSESTCNQEAIKGQSGGNQGPDEASSSESFFALLAAQHAKYGRVCCRWTCMCTCIPHVHGTRAACMPRYEHVLPMDLRVRGLVSAKFEYDGTALPWVDPGGAPPDDEQDDACA